MRSKLKVVLDTNIFIKAWFSSEDNNVCSKIMDLIDDRKIQRLFAQDTVGELVYLVKNFARHNITDVNDRLAMLHGMELFYYCTSVNTMNTSSPNIFDKYDEMFLKCAIEGKADYLVSDDFKSGMHVVDNINFTVVSSDKFIELF
ncbi:MAG: putative toxin-antitoxin system toxin component, PIN family [Desulfosporosinus sp.]|nr:putative toxin-antitoxin system toxin component, PIN family [Desulfosporosinus sp.]